MKYNPNSPYEKPLSECPEKCSECGFFGQGFCSANGIKSPTYGFCKPKDRCIPFPLHCPWWYANQVFDKMTSNKIAEIKEERIHHFVFLKMLLHVVENDERNALIKHFFRPSGSNKIDFEKYPMAKGIYEEYMSLEIQTI